ncbi:MAG: hypothetical protein U0M41_06295, partial [Negativibacillus sp.]|nr:hypothetical protein [Negativibacillus sp.]
MKKSRHTSCCKAKFICCDLGKVGQFGSAETRVAHLDKRKESERELRPDSDTKSCGKKVSLPTRA